MKKNIEESITKAREELKSLLKQCDKCGGNFNDDCRDCIILDKRIFYTNEIERMEKEKKKIFNATEARKMLEAEIENDDFCLEPIMEVISRAIKRKDNYCYINDKPTYVIEKLRKLGYNVGDLIKGDSCTEPYRRKISW